MAKTKKPARVARRLDAPVRFLRTQNGWCACVTIVYLALVAGGYAWARQPEDAWDQLTRTWLVMWESLAGCLFMFAIYLSAPSWWIKKSNRAYSLGYEQGSFDERQIHTE